jgi:hypothetical protein
LNKGGIKNIRGFYKLANRREGNFVLKRPTVLLILETFLILLRLK